VRRMVAESSAIRRRIGVPIDTWYNPAHLFCLRGHEHDSRKPASSIGRACWRSSGLKQTLNAFK
jgi:hypothetical protein